MKKYGTSRATLPVMSASLQHLYSKGLLKRCLATSNLRLVDGYFVNRAFASSQYSSLCNRPQPRTKPTTVCCSAHSNCVATFR